MITTRDCNDNTLKHKTSLTWSWRHSILDSNLSPTTRHVLLTLSCHMNNRGGSCYPSISTLANETGLSERAVITHLKKSVANGFLRKSKAKSKGQKWVQNTYEACWPSSPESNSPHAVVMCEPGAEVGEHSDIQEVNDVPTNLSPEISIEHSSHSPSPSHFFDGFEKFWNAYPKSARHNKPKCRRIWKRKGLEKDTNSILQSLEIWKQSKQWTEQNGKFICWPQKFLNEERYTRDSVEAAMRSTHRQISVSDLAKMGDGEVLLALGDVS